MGGAGPNPGDLFVCISCASVLIYEDGLSQRLATRADLERLDAKVAATLRRYQDAVRALDRKGMSNA